MYIKMYTYVYIKIYQDISTYIYIYGRSIPCLYIYICICFTSIDLFFFEILFKIGWNQVIPSTQMRKYGKDQHIGIYSWHIW